MKKLKNIIINYRHFLFLFTYVFLQLWFNYCEEAVRPVYTMYSSLDDHIPFVKEFVIPYLSWYIYMGFAFIYLGVTAKRDYMKLYYMLFFGMSLAYTIYLIFPNGQNLRPVITENDIFSRMIRHIYSTDTPTNVAPSIHVFNSLAVFLALASCEKTKVIKWLQLVSFLSMLSIASSTVLIKQHSIEDVFWGVILCLVLYGIIYKLMDKIMDKLAEKRNGDSSKIEGKTL